MGTIKLLLAGIAAGAVAGILFAPAKGTVTRRRIAHQASNYAGEVKNTFEEMMDMMTQRIDSIRGDVIHLRKQLMH
ncbi:MAG: YtxH domain-containing protein [Acidobacteriota bacterium]